MAFDIRLLGLDLDGTLLNRNKQISALDEEKIKDAMKKGVTIVAVTGRPQSGIPESVKQLFKNSYLITSNGAVTMDCKIEQDLDQVHMKADTVLKVISLVDNADEILGIEVFTASAGYVRKDHLQCIRQKYKDTPLQSYIETSRYPIDDLHKFILENEYEIVGMSIMAQSISIRKEIRSRLDCIEGVKITSSVSTDLELNDSNAGKGAALLSLAKRLGIEKAQIMACGDSGNDIDMIEAAGVGVVMENADSSIKKLADFVTLSNEHNGVAYAIDQYILTEESIC